MAEQGLEHRNRQALMRTKLAQLHPMDRPTRPRHEKCGRLHTLGVGVRESFGVCA
jgi:hypothetical protein